MRFLELSLRAIMAEHLPVGSWGPPLHDSLWDILILLSHINTNMVEERRSKLTRNCPREYGGLRQTSFPESQELFGEDPQGLLDSLPLTKTHNRAQNRSKGASAGNNNGRKSSFGDKK